MVVVDNAGWSMVYACMHNPTIKVTNSGGLRTAEPASMRDCHIDIMLCLREHFTLDQNHFKIQSICSHSRTNSLKPWQEQAFLERWLL
jgi:hypothetical protein